VNQYEWQELPEDVREAVQERVGWVVAVESQSAGRANFAATLCTSKGGRVFCKGVRGDDAVSVGMHRMEGWVGTWLPVPAPSVRWQMDVGDWMLLGFDHVDGRHAELWPRSPDLRLIAASLSELATKLTPCPVPAMPRLSEVVATTRPWQQLLRSPRDMLSGWAQTNAAMFAAMESAVAEFVAGSTLLHGDLHAENLLISDRAAHPVDWSRAQVGAAWVDAARLIPCLIEAGHSPGQAEAWAAKTAGWASASPTAVTAFAIEQYGMWLMLARTDADRFAEAPMPAVEHWARYRAGLTGIADLRPETKGARPRETMTPTRHAEEHTA